MAGKTGRRGFGHVRRLPSGRVQASYLGPDGRRHNAPTTFDGKGDAETWLSIKHSEIARGKWLPEERPKAKPVGFRRYAEAWLAGRGLANTTRELYRQLLRDHISPPFGDMPLTAITPAAVREWHVHLKAKPTAKAHAYALLRTIMNTAVADDVIPANPCRVRGAGRAKRARTIRPASVAELEVIAEAIPDRLRLVVILAAWCGLRFGELAELRRSDVDVEAGVLRVRRATTNRGGRVVKAPKSAAGVRDVAIPPHLMPMVKAHLRDHTQVGPDGLLFPARHGGHITTGVIYSAGFTHARKAAGRSDLRFHDLRHTGAVLAASTGATLAELMARLGHSTAHAAMVYQHAAKDRDRVIADALSKLVSGNVTPIESARKKQRKRPKKATG